MKETLTMFNIISDALKKIEKVKKRTLSYEDLTKHEQVVYEYRNQAIKLLQARVSMLMTMTIVKISPLKDSLYKGFKMTYLNSSFKSRYSSLGLALQKKLNKYVKNAVKASKLLKEIGESGSIHPKVAKLFKNMTYSTVKSSSRGLHPNVGQNQKEFLGYLKYYFKVQAGQIN